MAGFRKYIAGMTFVLISVFLLSSLAQAGPAYRRLVTDSPSEQSWRDGLSVTFETDEAACKRAYGESRWYRECQAPAPGREGQIVTGVTMTPPVPGTWRWRSETTMHFTPKTHLAPDTVYTISTERMTLPLRYSLSRNCIYRTQPQAVRIEHETLWIDPSEKGKHVLTVPLHFIWPMDRALLEKNVSFTGPSKSKLALGSTRFVWNEGQDEVLVTVPVLTLPEKNTGLAIAVQGLPSWHEENGKRVIDGKGPRKVQTNIIVTGTDRVMDVKSITLGARYDDGLDREYELVVTTTLATKPADVLEKLDLLLLPKKAKDGAGKDCNWENMPAISAEDIARSQKVTATLLQPGNEDATEIRLRVMIPEGRGLLCAMKEGLRSVAGYTLNRVRRFVRTAPALSPEINFLQPGNILPLKKGQKLDIHTVGIEMLSWEVAIVREPFLALMAKKTGFDLDDDVDINEFATIFRGQMNLAQKGQGKASYTALDLAGITGSDKAALMLVELSGHRDGKVVKKEKRLLLVSDLGLLLKTERNGSHVAFVQSLSKGEGVGNVEVSLLGANGLPLVSARTNSEGMCRLPSTHGFSREKKPSVLMARNGSDFAWLPLDENSGIVDYSDFAVSGRNAGDEGLMASVFSERGIYMPGEKLHFGLLVRNRNWTPLEGTLPIEGRLYDPQGRLLLKERLVCGRDGLATLTAQSGEATGLYRLDVCLVKGEDYTVIGSATTRVEEFEPDTLALDLRFAGGEPKGWIGTREKTQVAVHLDNLYGEPARGHRVRARFIQEPTVLSFPTNTSVKGFTFVDTALGEEREVELPDATTDDRGNCTLTLPADTPGLGSSIGRIEVEGFSLMGGRAVRKSLRSLFSPKDHVLGYRPEGDANNLAYIPQDGKAALRLLVLDAKLASGIDRPIRLSLSERRFVTSLVSDSSGRYSYEATPVDTEISAETVGPKDYDPNGILWTIPTKKAGEYLLSVSTEDGTSLGQIPFTVAGNSLAKPGQEPVLSNGALRLTVDRASYAAGDTISFQIAAPFEGRGIVTLERDSVVAHAFFTAEPGSSVHKLTIPRDFEGRGYLNVSFVRSLSSRAVYMDPHAYAVVPVTVGVKERDMGIGLSVPEQVLPGTDVPITLTAENEGRVQLFLVDEGVLQLTNYRVPDPLRDLLTDRALDVVTREAFHRVMPDNERLLGRIPGFGGGMGSAGGRFQNPFRRKNEPPFVYWSSIQQVGRKPVTVTVHVPPYFAGAFRVMAVGSGVSDSSRLTAGAAHASSRVRGGLLVKPELPLVVAPGDVFEGAIVIANTVAGSGADATISYTLSLPKGLTLTKGRTEGSLRIPENAERAVPLTFAVGDSLGEASLGCEVSLGGTRGKRVQSLSVRPASPMRATEKAVALNPAPEIVIASDRSLYPYRATTRLSIAEGPILAIRAVIDRLDSYPYGCTEQMISRAFPSVVLWDAPKLRELVSVRNVRDRNPRREGEEAIAAALARIRQTLQNDGVALWPESEGSSPFVTAYAGDFLVSMAEHGLTPPDDLRDTILSHLEDMVGRTPSDINDGRIKIYAAWVLLRDGRIMTSQIENLETWFRSNVTGWERDVLSSLLADSYATLRLRKKAAAFLPGSVGATDDPFLSTAVAGALHTLIVKNMGGKDETSARLLDAAFSENASTTELAMTCRALVALTRDAGTLPKLAVSCGDSGARAMQTSGALLELDAPACSRFLVRGVTEPGLHALLREDGFDTRPLPLDSKHIEITRQIQERGASVKRTQLGTVVTSRVCARSIGRNLDNVVLVDMVPGGLEPLLEGPEETEGLIRYERHEDRGLFFVSLTPEERCFTHKLRAATRGTFVVPQAHGEAMYEPAMSGTSAPGSLSVE